MKEIDGEFLSREIARLLEDVDCDYIVALFPAGAASTAMASMGLNLSDPDHVAYVLSRLIMHGDDLGWTLLELLQKVCRELPLPLHQLLAASHADYRELTFLHGRDGAEDAVSNTRIKIR